jgi:hypothetical protein
MPYDYIVGWMIAKGNAERDEAHWFDFERTRGGQWKGFPEIKP